MRDRIPNSLRTLLLRRDGTPRAIPFVSAPFSLDLMLFLALWPVWWVLGVDQILPPLFLAWEAARYLWQARGQFTVNAPMVWAGLLAAWWLVPALWVDREYADIFVKETATAWAQVCALFLFWNAVRTRREWNQAARGLLLLAAYVAAGGAIFALGIWRGTLVSALGRLFSGLAGAPGGFFDTIFYRELGRFSTDSSRFPFRLTSFALQPTSLSMICLILLPFVAWRFYEARGRVRAAFGVVAAGLLVCLLGTESRIAYLAFGVGVVVFAAYASHSLRKLTQLALFGGAGLAAVAVFLAAAVAFGGVDNLWQALVVDWRPGSVAVRSRVYEETLRLLPEHPIAGWGVQVRIRGIRSSFSAGSHSSVLAMGFRHGAVGLALYIGLWASIWREVARGLKGGAVWLGRGFWVAIAVALLCFNIRELADSWWWDQVVAVAVWITWGLVLAGARLAGDGHAIAEPAGHEEAKD